MKRKYIVLLHIIVWGLFLVNSVWSAMERGTMTGLEHQKVNLILFLKYFTIQAGYLLTSVFCFYSGYLVIAPQLLLKKGYLKATILAVATFFGVVALRYIMEYWFFLPVFGYDNYRGNIWPVSRYLTNILLFYFPSYFVYGLMLFFVEEWYKALSRRRELEKEKTNAELIFLRSQINPHFLFNSINDIYSLTYQKSEQAPAALLKLSEILRYMLREGREDMMPLQSEISYLENVIELQRISSKGAACIDFGVEGYIGNQQITTLLFIAFVENAFKHGVLNDPVNPVQISLTATNDGIDFTVRNKKNHGQKDKTSGIGLNNVRRRLALMYPDKHQLLINDDTDFYNINLNLQLT